MATLSLSKPIQWVATNIPTTSHRLKSFVVCSLNIDDCSFLNDFYHLSLQKFDSIVHYLVPIAQITKLKASMLFCPATWSKFLTFYKIAQNVRRVKVNSIVKAFFKTSLSLYSFQLELLIL